MKKRIAKSRHLIVSLLLLALVSCNFNTVYHSYCHTPSDGWGKNDTLYYEFPLISPMNEYTCFVEIRNTNFYLYRNLHLVVEHNLTDPFSFTTDTIECFLADEEGRWTGKGWGTLYQSSFSLKQFFISQAENYTIKIRHAMNDSILHGIEDVGIQINIQ